MHTGHKRPHRPKGDLELPCDQGKTASRKWILIWLHQGKGHHKRDRPRYRTSS